MHNKFFKLLGILISFTTALSLCSCSTYINTKLDIKKLNDRNENLGVYVLRPIFFPSMKQAKEFAYYNQHHNLLRGDNAALTITAKSISSDQNFLATLASAKSIDDVYIPKRNINAEGKFNREHFVISPAKYKTGFLGLDLEEWAVVKPEFFYTVGMLPAGKYFVTSIICDFCNSNSSLLIDYSQKDKDKMLFEIRAGHVNYLGDLYFINPERDLESPNLPFFPTHYNITHMLGDKSKDVKKFLTDFFPEIKLPFIKSQLYREKVEVTH